MKTQKRSKQLKQLETQSQSGRSMVEMLGVLAIIGVLSIGGITGYKYAMNYYQANQIAHEMNMMRTDAKIKIAQGADELILGDPYDDGNINFNNYETDFDCALADDAIIEENVSCRVANAFYIEMKNISQEICRPLSKLIQGMNELIGFEITTETIEADNEECQEGNNNIHAVFSAEAISELKSCKENTDCEELENTPYCDKTRHVCVRCYEDNQCAHTEYCEDNTCVACESGVWNGTQCVACTESTDCAEPLVCRNNECTTCQTEAECQAKGTTYHCSNEDTCIQCGANELWGEKDKGCVECLSPADCRNPEKPLCDTTTNTCIECETNAQCAEKGKDPHCHKETHTCEPCPDGSQNDTVRKACVIQIQTIPAYWTIVERDGVKRCQKLTPNHFGPYTHSYELWIHGSFDDYIRFYVNEELPHISSTEATLNEPDNNCNSISYRGEIHCAGSGCSGYISDSRLGTLNVGEFGHLTVYDITHWIAWGGMANTIRDDAAAWLVLGDE